MDDILLANSDAETLENNQRSEKKTFALLGIINYLQKIQRGYSINYLGHKFNSRKNKFWKIIINFRNILNDYGPQQV